VNSTMYMSIGDSEEAVECSPECRICGKFLGYGYGPDILEAKSSVHGSINIHFVKSHPELTESDIDANVDWNLR